MENKQETLPLDLSLSLENDILLQKLTDELKAMKLIYAHLIKLEKGSRYRVMAYLRDRLGEDERFSCSIGIAYDEKQPKAGDAVSELQKQNDRVLGEIRPEETR
jgi:hypothetical protein